MTNRILFNYSLIGFIILVMFNASCKKDQVPSIPVLSSIAPNSITDTSVISGGNITSDGLSTITTCGICWDTLLNPTIAGSKTIDSIGIGIYTSKITGLKSGKTYHLRAYATNDIGTAYGEDITFTTTATLPILTTVAVSALTAVTATCGGNITNNTGTAIISRGVCWDTSQNPTINNSKTINGSGVGSFISNIYGLVANTTYYVRAYATNSAGIAYGNTISFTTQTIAAGTVIDYDGNVYHTVTIGTQVWMVENLKTIHYRDGTLVPNVTSANQWSKLTTGAYCWFNNSASNKNTYGAIYNVFAVLDVRNLCPVGWHIPSNTEWTALTTYLGGLSVAGGKMKETGTAHWKSPNTSATNSSGFVAVGGGYCNGGGFWNQSLEACFWSCTKSSSDGTWTYVLNYNSASVSSLNLTNTNGHSVRCIKD